MRTVASKSGSRSYRDRGWSDSRSLQRKRWACAAWHSSGVGRVPGSPASSTVDRPRARNAPGSSARGRKGLAPGPSTPQPFREDASPPVFQSSVVSASPCPHSKYSAPRMLSCGGGGGEDGGAAGGIVSREFFKI